MEIFKLIIIEFTKNLKYQKHIISPFRLIPFTANLPEKVKN